jgi:hypothetical protein
MKLEMNRLNVEVGSRVRITNNEGLTTLRKENERLKSSVLDLQCQAMGANVYFFVFSLPYESVSIHVEFL